MILNILFFILNVTIWSSVFLEIIHVSLYSHLGRKVQASLSTGDVGAMKQEMIQITGNRRIDY